MKLLIYSDLHLEFGARFCLPDKTDTDLWIYGHTHECDDQAIGKIRIISNQLGYPNRGGGFECAGFDENGKETEV